MALFTDDFTGSADTLLTGRAGWTATSGYYGVLKLDGSGNLKKDGYSDDPRSAMNSVGSASHRFSAVVGAGFVSSAGSVYLTVATSSRNGWLGIRYDSAIPRLEVWSNRVEVGGSASLVSGLTGQTIAAGDTLAGSFDADTRRLIFSKNGTEIFNQVVTTEANGLTGQSVGVMLQYNTASANADLLRSWESQELGAAADTTAPTLTSATATATSGTTSSGSVSTNENNGTLYWLTNTSTSATAAAVKAGSSQAVTATGAQSTSSTGLSPGTTYYTHFLHRDAAGNDSAVLSSASFTTPALSASITLTTDGSTPAASLTGLTWGWWDEYPPDTSAAPVVGGSTGTTDASGVFTATLTGTALTTGQTGTLLIVNGDGTEGSTANNAFCGPVAVG